MKLIAIDSSGLVASVAVIEEDIVLAEYSTNNKQTHSQTLLPMLDEIAKRLDLDLSTVDAIAIAAGPGSFTGLRIGAATAKGLGFALDKPLVPVPTIDGLAYNMYGSDKLICPILDARRSQVYTGIYEFVVENTDETGAVHSENPLIRTYNMKKVLPQCAVSIDEIIDTLNTIGREVVFLGDGVPVFQEVLSIKMKTPYSFAPAHQNRQRAASVGTLGMIQLKLGNTQTAEEHEPEYLRLSQAEREKNLV